MDGRGLTRRETFAGAAAGAFALAVPARAADPLPLDGLAGGGFRAELVSVGQRGFSAWWPSDAPADTVVRIARADGRGKVRVLRLARRQTVHAARIDDLRPDTAYRYELRSGRRRVRASNANPGYFRTLPRQEGKRLATIAVLNDMHVGEQCSGTIQTIGGQSYPPCFTGDDYAYRMTAAAVREIRALKPDLLVANGDLTDRGRPDEMRRALELLRSARVPLVVTRGNHDRRFPEAGAACGADGDCMRAQAFPGRAAGDHALTSAARVGKRVGVVGLDSCDPDSGEGRLDLGGQLAFLDSTLAAFRREGRVPLAFWHHHTALPANATHPPPVVFGVNPLRGGLDAVRIVGRHRVPLVMHGHTHRNYLARDPLAPRTWFLENGATKEYPAGYALLHVYEDAIVRTFERPVDAFVREWVRTSARQIYGRQPAYTRGPLATRSFVLRTDGRRGPGGPAPSLLGPLGVPRLPSGGLLRDTVRGLGRGLGA